MGGAHDGERSPLMQPTWFVAVDGRLATAAEYAIRA